MLSRMFETALAMTSMPSLTMRLRMCAQHRICSHFPLKNILVAPSLVSIKPIMPEFDSRTFQLRRLYGCTRSTLLSHRILKRSSKEKVHFWPSNYCSSLILTMQLQNQISLTIELSKPFIFDHLAVLKGGFADVDDTWL